MKKQSSTKKSKTKTTKQLWTRMSDDKQESIKGGGTSHCGPQYNNYW